MTKEFGIYIIANSIVAPRSMGGGDRIFIELSKRWATQGHQIHLLVCKEGYSLCKFNDVKGTYHIISRSSINKLGVILSYFLRTFEAFVSPKPVKEGSIIYSSSDFLTDILPALLMKKNGRKIKWVSGFYLIAPNPFKKEDRFTLRSLTYYLSQRFAILLMGKYVDMVFVLNSDDKKYLERFKLAGRVKVIRGGVDIGYISSIKPRSEKTYDACFVGRLHQQKGLPDLIDIWERIREKKKDAKLAIIGWGSQKWQSSLLDNIAKRGLNSNIDFLGFLNGEEKFQILKSSKVFMLPSYRESWAIAVCEAMASGLPVIAYDLPAFKETYQGGIIRIQVKDIDGFANAALKLFEDNKLYAKLQTEALEVAAKYDWNRIAIETLQCFEEIMRKRDLKSR